MARYFRMLLIRDGYPDEERGSQSFTLGGARCDAIDYLRGHSSGNPRVELLEAIYSGIHIQDWSQADRQVIGQIRYADIGGKKGLVWDNARPQFTSYLEDDGSLGGKID